MQHLQLAAVMAEGMCCAPKDFQLPLISPLLCNSKPSNPLQLRREQPASSISEAAQM